MIHVLHGFLGSPEDFSFLPQRKDIKIYDLLGGIDFTPSADDTLIGYSMGGRIALEMASITLPKKVILLAAHPGLSREEEIVKRKRWEDLILSKFDEGEEEFLRYWNQLPLFSHDEPIKLKNGRFLKFKNLFERMRLSRQENFLPLIKNNPERFLWVVGKQDDKYSHMASELLAPLGVKTREITGGHRLYQRQVELLQILKEEGVL